MEELNQVNDKKGCSNITRHSIDKFNPISLLSSKNNPQVEIRFRDLFPVSLTGLQYDQQATDVEYLTSTVTFRYTIYDFANVGSATTQVTTS